MKASELPKSVTVTVENKTDVPVRVDAVLAAGRTVPCPTCHRPIALPELGQTWETVSSPSDEKAAGVRGVVTKVPSLTASGHVDSPTEGRFLMRLRAVQIGFWRKVVAK